MVKIRLARRGRKDRAMYSIVAADVRAPRDGRFIEKIGTYNPQDNPSAVIINETSALAWLAKGAQMTETVRLLFASQGILLKRHLAEGVHKGAIAEAEASKRFEKWAKETAKKKKPFMLAESSSAGQIVATIKEKTASEAKPKVAAKPKSKGSVTAKAAAKKIAKPAEAKKPAAKPKEVAKPTEAKKPAAKDKEVAKPTEAKKPAAKPKEVAKPTEAKKPAAKAKEVAKPAEAKIEKPAKK